MCINVNKTAESYVRFAIKARLCSVKGFKVVGII